MDFNKYQEVVRRYKKDGVYIGVDGHLYDKKDKPKSRMSRNGYYVCRKMINGHQYHLMEHRVIWCWHKGDIDDKLEINHIDFDKTNNLISNLELVTRKENVNHSRDNLLKSIKRGVDSPNAKLTKEDVQLIRYLRKNGYSQKETSNLYGMSNETTISRVLTGARYGNVPDSVDLISIYPLLVEKLRNREGGLKSELSNYSMGLAGEAGELIDILKKHIYQGHDLNEDDLILELGDILFYIVAIANILGINFTDIYLNNMNKLDKRYPKGFTKNDSINRFENN